VYHDRVLTPEEGANVRCPFRDLCRNAQRTLFPLRLPSEGVDGKLWLQILLLVGMLLPPRDALAQFDWRGKPPPEGRYFLITESGPYLGTELGVHADLGIMKNTGSLSAVGMAFHGFLGSDIETNWGSVGLGLRHRLWINRRWAFDTTPRIQWTRRQDTREWSEATLGGTVAFSWKDLLGLAVAADSYHGMGPRFCVGITFGSYAGVPGAVAMSMYGIGSIVYALN
jgi:hypothetical protein